MLKNLFAALALCASVSAFAGEKPAIAICDTDRKASGEPCQAYVGSAYSNGKMLQYAKHACDSTKSKWSAHSTCPARGRVGVCKISAGTPNEMWDFYYAKEQEAARACTTELFGTWSSK